MKPQDLAQTLKAGGLVPHSARLGNDDAVDSVVARAYRHPVLPGRTVVRLTAESVAAGDDLEMATLGFGPPEDRGPVARARKRPLGFPGWALVHDPENARYALDVVKEFKKHARKARSRPGHAKDGIDAIADRLSKTVPHFLPSFFEEAGRVFIEHGATSYAAAMFGKARAAEAVHALDVDEQHRVDGFLEFALAGAVTTRALTEYARELAEHHAPEVAYGHFRQLCLQRTLGGMPPWAGMAKDLRRLARAAGLDPDEEDRKLVAEIIESPALARAAGEFWRAYQAPITALARRAPRVRGALLDLFPTASPEVDELWLDLIEQTGAIDALVGDAPDDARPSGGRAAWFNKLTQHLARRWNSPPLGARVFQLLRRMARAVAGDGAALTCCDRRNALDLDLAELALELGVPVEPPEGARIGLAAWAKVADELERGRDPVRAMAHPRLGPLLVVAVAGEMGSEPFDTASRGKAGLLAAKRVCLEVALVAAETEALPALENALALVADKVKPATFAELPDLHARLAAIDLAPALARTLQIGLLDELGWPALEDVERELDPDGKTSVALHGGLPAVVLATRTRAVAVGIAGRLAAHDLVIPAGHELLTIRYIGGQFLVVLTSGWRVRGYWSAAPHDLFDSDQSQWQVPAIAGRVAVLADGAWHEGARAIRVGDRAVPLQGLASHDGSTAWITERKDGRPGMREVSASGEPGRISWPARLAADLAPDWHLDAKLSYVLPAPDGLTDSPLGIQDGLLGARVAYRGSERGRTASELVAIDGRTWSGASALEIGALVELPSGESRLLALKTVWREGMTLSLLDDHGVLGVRFAPRDRRTWRGSVAAYPDGLWHALTARDVAGSKRLRAITVDDARAMIRATDASAGAADLAELVPADVVARQLPEVAHERLRRGIAGVVALAAQLQRRRDELCAQRAPGEASARGAPGGPDDAAIQAALGGWIDHAYVDGGAALQIARCGELFGSADHRDRTVLDAPGSRVHWLPLAVAPGALAFLVGAVGLPPDHRRTIAALLAAIARELPDPAKLRVWSGKRTSTAHDVDEAKCPFALRWHGGNAYAITKHGWGEEVLVLEYAPGGVFKPLPRITIGQATRGVAAVPAAIVAAALATGRLGRTGAAPRGGPAANSAVQAGARSSSDVVAPHGSPSADALALASSTDAPAVRAGAGPSPDADAGSLAMRSVNDAAALAVATGLTPSEAVYLLAGCPGANTRTTNFLDKELRELLGLKAAQAAVARDALAAIPRSKRLAVLDEAGRGGDLAAAWIRHVGKRVAVPEALIAAADRELQAPIPPSQALPMFGSPADAPALNSDARWSIAPDGDTSRDRSPAAEGRDASGDHAVFDVSVLRTACAYLPFLYAELPVGDPLRAQAPIAHARVLARLANPSLLIDLDTVFVADEDRPGVDSLISALGGEPVTGLDERSTGKEVAGALIIRQSWTAGGRAYVRLKLKLRPATLDARAAPVAGKLAALAQGGGDTHWQSLQYIRSSDLAAMMARIGDTPVPAGGWEQNPSASAPGLVDEVARKLGVSSDAAALYLQYLVLLWPTPKNLAMWNGWSAKRIASASVELEKRELVLEARRERAQRVHFLPGGWEALRSPHPPMESWKLLLYGARSADGSAQPLMMRFAALAPFHLLFERAWQRIEAGDLPRYDEVKR